MQDFAARTPTIPIPFHKLLKVVALVDAANPQVAALLDMDSVADARCSSACHGDMKVALDPLVFMLDLYIPG